jgi:hypothetical protein
MSDQRMASILAGLLDTFDYPVWIRGVDGDVIANGMAEGLDPALNLEALANPSESLFIAGRSYKLKTRDINHGTNLTMFELQPIDEGAERIRACARRVDEALKLASF